jgi:uncharacterized protein YndB with AHSA1/START domain
VVRWQGTRAELDPRPGGIYRVHVRAGITASGQFVEVQPYRRVVFTWGFERGTRRPHPLDRPLRPTAKPARTNRPDWDAIGQHAHRRRVGEHHHQLIFDRNRLELAG